ncbi:MAG: hypothetical protein IKC26_09540 [Clostridia bacterium]|nr:hypothetical protein [Clostridia bacterium]
MTILQLIVQYALQIAVTVGMILLTGIVIAAAKRLFLGCCGSGAYYVELITGLVGTPIHELSHAFFCILFGHKITGICLWTPNPQNGNLGYVMHTYKRRNLWHQIGNFFIGVAPIIGGNAVLLLLLRLLLPDAAGSVFSVTFTPPQDPSALPSLFLSAALTVLKALFVPSNFLSFHWYLYLFFAVLIVLHMEVSRSDIRAGLWGLGFIALLWLLADLALFFLYPAGLFAVTDVAVSIGALLSVFLCLAVILAGLLLVVSLVFRILRRR